MNLITTTACIDCSGFVAQMADPVELSQRLLAYLHDNLLYQRGAIILTRPSDERPQLFAHCRAGMDDRSFAEDMRRVNRLLARRSNGVVHRVLAAGQETVVGDVTLERGYIEADSSILSEACFPLIVKGACIGALNFESQTPGFFGADDALLLKVLSTQLALRLAEVRADAAYGAQYALSGNLVSPSRFAPAPHPAPPASGHARRAASR